MNLSLEKIKGCIYGYAIGDALGLGTEFMTKPEATRRYPDGLRDYSHIIRDAHRSQWRRGDFTLDTDVVLLMLDAICANGNVTPQVFAAMMRKRYEQSPYDFESHLRWVINQPDFLENPEVASRRVWEERYEAFNEALGRALLIGTTDKDHRRKIIENCRTTHYDPRCVTSALIIGEVSHRYLRHDHECTPDELIALAEEHDESAIEYIQMAADGDLAALDLDDEDTYWYTRKTMAAALWAFWHADSPEEALYTIVDEAGDADTNASLATGLLGMKHGFSSLPSHLVEGLVQRERVEKASTDFYDLLVKLTEKHK